MDEFRNKKVWVSHPTDGFILGRISDIGSDSVSITTISGSKNIVVASYDAVYPAEEDDMRDVEDNCGLMYLNEATLLNNVRLRYNRNQIYTYVANILISINPYVDIPDLYSSSTVKQYQGKSLGVLPPHIFAIADKAYRDMKRLKESQSIVVSGESGAGKTESQKCVLRYLCESWGKGSTSTGSIERRILDTNPILEAFGNAKTLRNNNSSRFGKFVEIHFDKKYAVSGGFVSHYLLEKSRIVHQHPEERNYHIFYQLCAGAPKEMCTQLRLLNPDAYHYLRYGFCQYFCSNQEAKSLDPSRISQAMAKRGMVHDPVINDVKDFGQLDAALGDLGMDQNERFYVYATVAAVLHLGNIVFVEDPEDSRGYCAVDASSEPSLVMAAGLLGIDRHDLLVGLTSRVMQPSKGGNMGTIIKVPLKTSEAAHARDALAKAIYSRLFDYIVKRINICIPLSGSEGYIGVLDIAGFEYFTVNSFEQFCINYCNEKLQQFFNDRILRQEQELYQKEGLNVKRIEYVDNQDCIDLIEDRSYGILSILDEESKLPRPTPQHFTTSVHQTHKGHFRLAVPRKSKLREHRDIREDEGLLIRHFAGAVCYNTSQFVNKNNDALHVSLEMLMQESKSPLLKKLFEVPDDDRGDSASRGYAAPGRMPKTSARQGKLGFVSVGSKFRSQLNLLMEKLDSTGTNFVRCIKPNSVMKDHKFDGASILSQLQCSGMASVLSLMQQGYPSRTQFAELYAMYKKSMPEDLARLDPRLFCKCLFKALGLNDTDYKFGLTKVFFRPGKFAEFDQMLRADPENLAVLIKKVRRWLLRYRWRKAQYGALSVIKLKNKILWRRARLVLIQSWIRSWLAQRRYRHKIQGLLKVRSLSSQISPMGTIVAKLHKDQAAWQGQINILQSDLQALVMRIRNTNITTQEIDFASSALTQKIQTTLNELRKQVQLQSVEQERLKKLQEEMERERRAKEEAAKRQRELDEQKRIRYEMELKRKLEEEQEMARFMENEKLIEEEQLRAETLAKQRNQQLEQEKRDRELALRLAAESNGHVEDTGSVGSNDSLNKTKYDLSKWRYAELRDVINTSNDIELLEACRDEFHRRLKVYHHWKTRNRAQKEPIQQRAPNEVVQDAVNHSLLTNGHVPNGPTLVPQAPQRFFRIPFVRPGDAQAKTGGNEQRRGWWYAHFDGQYIARQMELHPDKVPVLLVAGRDDIQMCELKLEETGLTRKRGAEILSHDFETEWVRFSGPKYVPIKRRPDGTRI